MVHEVGILRIKFWSNRQSPVNHPRTLGVELVIGTAACLNVFTFLSTFHQRWLGTRRAVEIAADSAGNGLRDPT